MANGLRTDSLDHRTELLSPAAQDKTVVEQSWRLNFDDAQLPEQVKDSSFGVANFIRSASKFPVLFISIN